MHRARATLLREIGPSNLSGPHACRAFGEVVSVTHHANGFIAGTARIGPSQVVFDAYSFQQAGRGLSLGPFFLRGYGKAKDGPIRKHAFSVSGRTSGTMVYGTVIQVEPGKYRYLDAVVANEFHFFWSTLQLGKTFVHTNRRRYYLDNGAGCGDLYAAACVLVGDVHTLVYACMSASVRPVGGQELRLSLPAVQFVILLSIACRSGEPYRLFEQVVRAHEASVDKAVVDSLYLPTSALADGVDGGVGETSSPVGGADGEKQPGEKQQSTCLRITPGCIRHAVAVRTSVVMAQVAALGGRVGEDSDDESCGLLSDDEDFDGMADNGGSLNSSGGGRGGGGSAGGGEESV